MNQHIAETPVDPNYSELIRKYGREVFNQACAIAKVAPISVSLACERIKRAKAAATAPFVTKAMP